MIRVGNKFGNKITTINGRRFASAREALRYRELDLMQRAGMITKLKCQVRFELIPAGGGERAAAYIADFVYTEKGKEIVEDVKGVRTDLYILKRKIMLWRFGIKIRET
jgi:hypothetical protein